MFRGQQGEGGGRKPLLLQGEKREEQREKLAGPVDPLKEREKVLL